MKKFIERIKTSARSQISGYHSERSRILPDQITKRSRCQDPHDRIYAILGIATDIQKYERQPVKGYSIPIDYERSIFKIKMDVVWFYHHYTEASRDAVPQLCSLLDEIFADCPDDE